MAEKQFAQLSFEQAVRKYSDTVTGVCIMRLQNYADAEDCYQNVFLKLYKKSPEFENEEHLKAWLIRVAINECESYRRKNRIHSSLEEAQSFSAAPDNDSRDISWALIKTPPKYRDVLYLHYKGIYIDINKDYFVTFYDSKGNSRTFLVYLGNIRVTVYE